MRNAVHLKRIKSSNKLNINIVIEELCSVINKKIVNQFDYSKATYKRLIKAKKILSNNGNNSDAIYELVKSHKISKRIFLKTIKIAKKGNINYLYINYKYLNEILKIILKFIILLDSNILKSAENFSMKYFTSNKSKTMTYKLIPERKILIERCEKAYINYGGTLNYDVGVHNKFVLEKLYDLNKQLNELNKIWGVKL